MFRSTKCAMCINLNIIALFLPLLLGIGSPSGAATVDIVSFNAELKTTGMPPITNNKISFSYTASWSESGRQCSRTIFWYQNYIIGDNISNTVHYVTPVNSSGTADDAPRTEGGGNYYEITVKVYNTAEPNIVYVTRSQTDSDFY